MRRTSLDTLTCPICHSELHIETLTSGDFIQTGSLVCEGCQRNYSIQNGVPHFIIKEQLTGMNRQFARLYNWFSWVYGAFSKLGFIFLGTSETVARGEILDRLNPRGGRVLEVSIGPGVNLPFLFSSADVKEVFGLDISIGQINRCRSLIRRKGWPVELFLGNAEELPFKENSFDSVFHIGGINFFSQKEKAIHEMIRVAKPGTRIVVCDENETGARQFERILPGFKRALDGQRDKVTAPVGLVPASMIDVNLENVWKDFMYCLEFTKPLEAH